MSAESQEVTAAVAAARAQPHGFVFMPGETSDDVRAALTALAVETGRELVQLARPSVAELKARQLADDTPTIDRSDSRAFIKNLGKIAKGQVGVR